MSRAIPFTAASLARAIKGVEQVGCTDLCYNKPMRKARMTEMGAKYVYVIKRDETVCKIGISRKPKARRNSLQGASPERLSLFFSVKPKTRSAIEVEQSALRLLDFLGRRGEWLSCRAELASQVVSMISSEDPTVGIFAAKLRLYLANETVGARRALWTEFPALMLAYEGRRFGQRLLGLLKA